MASQQLAEIRAWFNARYGVDDFEERDIALLFYDKWKLFSREIELMFTGIGAVWQGNYPQGWNALSQLEHHDPRAYESLNGNTYLSRYYTRAAWRSGHFQDAKRLLKEFPPDRELDGDLQCNLRLSPVWPAPPARAWSIIGAELQEVGLARHEEADGMLLSVPALNSASLLRIPDFNTTLDAGWWQWDGQNWRERPQADRQELTALLRYSPSNTPVRTGETQVSASRSNTAEYLSLHGNLYGTPSSLLLRIDHGIKQIPGHAAQDVYCHDGDVWVHGEFDIARLGADGSTTTYRDDAILRSSGDIFTPPQRRRAPFTIDGATWQLAHDGAGRLQVPPGHPVEG